MEDGPNIDHCGRCDRTFLVLLIGIGPKFPLVPFLEITASLDPAAKQRVLRKMLATAAAVAAVLMVLGELLRVLPHFTIGSLSIRRRGDLARARGAPALAGIRGIRQLLELAGHAIQAGLFQLASLNDPYSRATAPGIATLQIKPAC